MARLRLELRDIAELVRDIVNRHQPLVAESFSFGKWLFKSQFDVTWHALEEVRVDGPIILESALDAGHRKLLFDALVPNLGVSGPCTIAGGGFLFKDRTRPLEISLNGTAQVEVRFDETNDHGFDAPTVRVALTGFRVSPHVFPKWVERRFQRPVERALEEALAKLIVESIPKAVTELGLASPAEQIAEVSRQLGHATPDDSPRQSVLSTLAYRTSYYLAYGLCYPVLRIGSRIPTHNPAVQGLRDGAASASSDVQKLKARGTAQPANRGVVAVPAAV